MTKDPRDTVVRSMVHLAMPTKLCDFLRSGVHYFDMV